MIKRCTHKWKKVKEIRRYFDVSGIEIVCHSCCCEKCGKQKERKYMGHIIGQLFVR